MSYKPPVGAATATTQGIVKLAGDFAGTADTPTVPGLAGKANTSHTHAIVDTTGLQTALDGKAASSHTHAASDISDSTATGRAVMTAADAATARTTLGITNTVQVVDDFADVTTPVYGTLYVMRA